MCEANRFAAIGHRRPKLTVNCEYLAAWLDERLSDHAAVEAALEARSPALKNDSDHPLLQRPRRPDVFQQPGQRLIRARQQLLSTPRVEGIEAFEYRGEVRRLRAALGMLSARRRAVALVRAAGLESAATTGAQDAARKACARFLRPDRWQRYGRQELAHAATT